MIKVELVDGKGLGNKAEISQEGAIHTLEHPHPPITEQLEVLPFRERFNLDGDSDMNKNGSVNPLEFYVKASENFDIWVKTIFVEIADGGSPALNKFGSLPELTNGVEWLYFNQKQGEYTLHEGIKNNKEFIRIGIDTHGIGTGVDAYLADTSGGGTEKAYLPIIDLGEMYGMKYGLRLRKATTDCLYFRINDNLTGLSQFNAIAYGIRI